MTIKTVVRCYRTFWWLSIGGMEGLGQVWGIGWGKWRETREKTELCEHKSLEKGCKTGISRVYQFGTENADYKGNSKVVID